jgi:1,4-alpha-glucan branching enzyme
MKNALLGNPPGISAPTSRFSVQKTLKPVNFVCLAPDANEVFLVGDFNNWDQNAHPMKRVPDGTWTTQLALTQGYQHYLFLVDGQRTLDPRAYGIAQNEFGEKVSLLAVS